MNIASTSGTHNLDEPADRLGWRTGWAVGVLLLAQIGLYVWMAPRGFEFTDEAYYFLNYLYWRDFVGVVSFFGAYFELPFRLLGQDVALIRIFGMLAILVCSAFFLREASRYFSRHDQDPGPASWPFIAAGAACSLFYFGYLSTLRAPSYNLLSLCAMLLATGCLLRLVAPENKLSGSPLTMICYGLVLGACGLGKASTGLLLITCHAAFFAFANPDWRLRRIRKLLLLGLAGACVNFAVLQSVHPGWLAMLLEGVSLFSYSSGSGLIDMANSLRWDVQRLAVFAPWAAGIAAAFALTVRWLPPKRRGMLSMLVLALTGATVIALTREDLTRLWLPLLALTALLLWTVEYSSRRPVLLLRRDAVDLALLCLFLALPVAFSFGTNMPVLEHSEKAAIFAATPVVLMLQRLTRTGLLSKPSAAACLALLCLPTLLIQARAALDVEHTYRQLSPLGAQSRPIRLGSASTTLLVDTATYDSLQAVMGVARTSGFVANQPILDFTGDGPGLMYALGGRPVGLAWLLGGYPNSRGWAERMVAQLPAQELRNAWILSSDNNPRAIEGWQPMLSERIGSGTHEQIAVVTVRATYGWGKNPPERINVQLWRPAHRLR